MAKKLKNINYIAEYDKDNDISLWRGFKNKKRGK